MVNQWLVGTDGQQQRQGGASRGGVGAVLARRRTEAPGCEREEAGPTEEGDAGV